VAPKMYLDTKTHFIRSGVLNTLLQSLTISI